MSSRSGNKCLTPDHDVLTGTRGWIPIADVALDDTVACLIDGQLEYRIPEATHTYDHEGPMYEVSSQMIDLCVTPNHRMYVRKVSSRGQRYKYGFEEPASLFGKQRHYKRNAANPQPDIPTHTCYGSELGEPDLVLPMDGWLKLLGLFISDGWVESRKGHNRVLMRMSKPRKIAHVKDALAEMACPEIVASYDNGPGKVFTLVSPQVARDLEPLSVGALHKRLPAYVWKLSERQARVLLDALIEGDGSRGQTMEMYFTSSPGLADDVQRLCLHAGWSGNISVSKPAGNQSTLKSGKTITSNADSLRISIVKAKNEPLVYGKGRTQSLVEHYVDYQGTVHCLTVPGGVFYVRRHKKPVWTGNSIVARMLQQSDMPFTERGLTPDMIINTHSFPSRMTIGQLIETSLGKICARKGVIADGTAFLPVDHLEIAADMRAAGFRYNGRERMYNGMTGEYFDAAIFIGPTAVQRLQKFVLDDEQSVAGSGPTDATTGQPLGGKHHQGGLRLGEMENWALEAHGSMVNLHEKVSLDSDGRTMSVCRGCAGLAVYNEYHNVYSCRSCGELADISLVDGSKTAVLLHEELAASNICVQLGLRPREFEEGARELVPRDFDVRAESQDAAQDEK